MVAVCVSFCIAGCDEGSLSREAETAERLERASAASASREGAGDHEGTVAAEFVGVERCAACHVEVAARWRGSDHDRAMQRASSDTIRAPFAGETLREGGRLWRFLRDGAAFRVELERPGAPTESLDVVHAFGDRPLQQVLVRRPGGGLQALPLAWDVRPTEQGGGRWFALQPDEPAPEGDPLHWDALAYNWNSQCAACHSTALAKGFDDERGVFETRWAEIDVGCEACHGPGARHAAALESGASESDGTPAALPVRFERWQPARWSRSADARIASREAPRAHDAQLDVCGPCHARRAALRETPEIGAPLLEGYRPRLVEPGLYFDDGQIRDEVYVWGSFLQSRMHAAGVRCADCHDPHSLELRRPGNALCGGCHAPSAYDRVEHRGHPAGGAGTACVDCHMPARVYMQVDPRRDHAFPIPRPLRSAPLSAPDGCTGCHAQRSAAWAAEAIAGFGDARDRPPRPHWSDALVDESEVAGDAWLKVALDAQAPPIVRGGAWQRVAASQRPPPEPGLLARRLRAADDLERLGLIELTRRLPARERMELLRPLLAEATPRALRVAASDALLDAPLEGWRPADRAALARSLRLLREAHEANAERPEAQLGLGRLALRYGDPETARRRYEKALERAPWFVPAWVNLADLERAEGRDAEAIALLGAALERAPEQAEARHALGLALHRAGRREEALEALARAARDAPAAPRMQLGWALALDADGRRAEALDVIESALARGAGSPELHHTRVAYLREQGELERARLALEAFARDYPDDPRVAALSRARTD